MDFRLNRVQVWSAEVPDRPGGVAGVLAPLAEAGANLEFIWTRRLDHRPGWGIIFVAPITGPAQTRAAHSVGFAHTNDLVLCASKAATVPASAISWPRVWPRPGSIFAACP